MKSLMIMFGQALPVDGLPEIKDSSLVVCFGEMLIDFVPTISGLSLADAPAFKEAPGGAPANVAVGIARLSGSSVFIGKVGEDEFGYMLANILKENNVNSEGMRFDPGARTALAIVTLRSDGEREFMFYRNPSADMLLQENELDFDLITKSTNFHHGSVSLITEPCKSAHVAAAKAAKDISRYVSMTFFPFLHASYLDGWTLQSCDDWNCPFRCLLRTCLDIFSLMLQSLGSLSTLKMRIQWDSQGLGGRRVDITGAGDAFVAGTLSQLASDLSLLQDEDRLRDALLFSNACGALTVAERGAIPALPTREAVRDAIVKNVAKFSSVISSDLPHGEKSHNNGKRLAF
ncbi:putative fructokinase-6 [Hibiscus syriacus]|uniref:Fructokinase-6 n=1 Tax=Hibiscus syriacus TaxID=106335 RepID=A0A6A2YZ34_HIBSY|nr:putative fructokinase-6 [Hibiscus syriacus]